MIRGKGTCDLCGSSKKIEKHHTSYFPEVCIFVCKACHEEIHCGPYENLMPPRYQGAVYHTVKSYTIAKMVYPAFAAGILTRKDLATANAILAHIREGGSVAKRFFESDDYKRIAGYIDLGKVSCIYIRAQNKSRIVGCVCTRCRGQWEITRKDKPGAVEGKIRCECGGPLKVMEEPE